MKNKKMYPLSPAEEQLWLQWILEPNNPYYNIQSAIRIYGILIEETIELCFKKLIMRHEALRSAYKELKGNPIRVLLKSESINYEMHDLSNQSVDESEKKFAEILLKQENKPFDLSIGQLIRFTLFKFGLNEYILAITAHHIIVDARSLDLILHDLGELYKRISSGETISNKAEYQLSDFTDMQIRKMQNDSEGMGLQYWKNKLGNDTSPFLIPRDYTPDSKDHKGDRITTVIPEDLFHQMIEISRSYSCSLYTVAASVLLAASHRISENDRIILGTNVSCRTEPDTEDIVGLCINMLPLFSDISGEISFKDLITKLQQQKFSDLQYSWIPLSSILAGSKAARKPGLETFIPFIFNFYYRYNSPFKTPSLKSEYINLKTNFSRFDIVMTMIATENSAQLNITYNTALYDRETIKSLSEHYISTAEALLKRPEIKFKKVFRMATLQNQVKSVLTNPPLNNEEYPTSIIHAFRQQVIKNGNIPAVIDNKQKISYKELDLLSDAWSNELRELGVKHGDIVAMVFEPSIEMIIGIISILKIGAAYAPIDPTWPTERINQITTLVSPSLILTNVNEHNAKSTSTFKWIDSNSLNLSIKGKNTVEEIKSHDLAYVLFTSGSTGNPKAVAVEHAQVVAYTMGVFSNLKLKSHKGWPVVCTYSADITVTPLFGSLMTGGYLIMLSKTDSLDAKRIASWKQLYAMDYLKLAPSHISALFDQDPDGNFLPNEMVIIGGELLTWELVNKIQKCVNKCRIGNHYSPCETTCGILTNDVTEALSSMQNTGVPMGTPLPGVCVTVADRYQSTIARGLPGEIIISGKTVTRGYLNNQELTVNKFLNLNWHPEHNSRCYKSGDIGRLNPDSKVEFICRQDNQIKIRGFRVELNEVERILEKHPSVSQAGVTPMKGKYENEGLIAFIRPTIQNIISETDLRQFTRAHLPDYMVPTIIVCQDKLPLNHNGKLDRFKLAEDSKVLEDEYFQRLEKPVCQVRSETMDNHTKIRKAWEMVLGTNSFSDNDKFFEIGGDSIKLMRVYSELHGSLDVKINIADFFNYNTISDLVSYYEKLIISKSSSNKHN